MLENTTLSPSAKTKSVWSCQECGHESGGYLGRCSLCGAWGSFVQKRQIGAKSQERARKPKHGVFLSAPSSMLKLEEIPDTQQARLATNSSEFNQVIGGGIVPGSMTLIGGEPGIGKSTLLLQLATGFARDLKVLYVSAEESSEQIKLRARRLDLLKQNNELYISTENNLEQLLEKVQEQKPGLIIIDSIQTIYLPELDSIPGSPTQIRECAANLMRFAKSTGIPIIIVGHINKDGDIAGPKILEHMVDTVLQFEGERDASIRTLRSIKNRFGSTDEIALFLMQENGLQDLSNPSSLFLSQRAGGIVFASKEGKRSLLLEIQSLVLQSEYSNPRRVVNGVDYNRLQQILAILDKRLGVSFAKADVYCNIAGGIQIKDPAADLAIALSVIASSKNMQENFLQDTVALGELGLMGEIRSVANLESRIREAAKQGFKRVICPWQDGPELTKYAARYHITIKPLKNIRDYN